VMRRLLSDISFNLPSERHTETAGQEPVELREQARKHVELDKERKER
jgi:hypothetical protein